MTVTQEDGDMSTAGTLVADDATQSAADTPRHSKALHSDFETIGDVRVANPRMSCTDVDVYYGDKHAIKGCSLAVGQNPVINTRRT